MDERRRNSELLSKAVSFHQAGNLNEAETLYRTILSSDSRHFDALTLLGTIYLQRGQREEGVRLIGLSLEISPNQLIALNNRGNALNDLKRPAEALASFNRAIALNPGFAEAYSNRGNALNNLTRPAEALASYDKAIALNPGYAEAYSNRGNVLNNLARYAEALASCDRAIALNPGFAEAYYNRGNVLNNLARPAEALASYDKAIALNPGYAEAYYNRGNVLNNLARPAEALASYDKAIALNPGYAEAYSHRGNALNNLKRPAEALASCDKAIALNPGYAEAYSNRGNALLEQNRQGEALTSYDRALALKPDYAEAYYNRGVALQYLNRQGEALTSYDRALVLKPDYAEAHYNRGIALQHLKRPNEAFTSYERVLALKQDFPYLGGSWLHCKMLCCHWEDLDAAYIRIANAIDRGETVSFPFDILAMPSTPAQQQRCAQIFIRDKHPGSSTPLWQGERYAHDRIRIGYFSSDFRNHAMAYLIAEMIERHDRSKFEIIAFSYSPSSDAPIRRRLEKAFDRFIDVSTRNDHEIATLAKQLEIDIAIDLNGFTTNSRTAVFALRPAPIQVNHLGYPGTMGAHYIDYIIADKTVIPPEHLPHYTEQIVYLPHTYWFNDSTKVISDRHFGRAELGLPDDSFVFCCFNNNYKITPDLFDIWMRLLHTIQGSTLWLFKGDETAANNLRREAEKRGISADRLVFAPRMEMAEHLARHRQADLFLDTFYYNSHTTASDALWAGLPVLTCLGDTFAGRVAASLLQAVGLPELITHSHDEYEALALELATHPERLAALRRKLAENRSTHPLFDTARFTRHIEEAYSKMFERYQAGLAPDHIVVGAHSHSAI